MTLNRDADQRGLFLFDDATDWRRVSNLLKTGQYEQSAELLQRAQLASEQAGNLFTADVLAATRQICLACRHYRTEIAWHEQAHEAARDREEELRGLLESLLVLISQHTLPSGEAGQLARTGGFPAQDQSEARREYQRVWRRIQNLLGWGANDRPDDREPGPTRVELSVALEGEAATAAKPLDSGPEVGSYPLVVCCLGPFQVYQNNQLISGWSSLKAQAILKYLVARQATPVAKDILMELFWPEAEPEAARRNLHQAIYSLRHALRQANADFQPILFESDCYLLNPELSVWIDWKEFERHARRGRRLAAGGQINQAVVEYSQAEQFYHGDFLEEDIYEDWPRLQREQLRNIYLELTDWLSEYYLQQGEYAATIALSQKILDKDNCHEKAHCRLMQCYQRQGQRGLALRQYQLCLETLKQELGVTPSTETQALYEQIAGKRGTFAFAPSKP